MSVAEYHLAEYRVAGMTCAHCVNAVTEELSGLAGVAAVEIALVEGGLSTVMVRSAEPLPADAVHAAVAEAGYQLAS